MLSVHEETGFRWRYRGATPRPEVFVNSLYDQVLAQFVVVRATSGEPIGLVVAYGADTRNGHVFFATLFDPRVSRQGWPFEGIVLFANYLFATWNFRKIYAESLEFNYAQFASGAGRLFTIEARLSEFEFWDGRYWDKLIGSCSRERWNTMRPRLMNFALGSRAKRLHSAEPAVSSVAVAVRPGPENV